MHSLSMAQNILQAALKEAKKYDGKRIKAVKVTIGEENFVESDSLQFCLEAMAKGTIAEGARIEIGILGATTEIPECAVALELE
jgi:hydrogenase nickel incorporation protein HypA/HybF